VVIHSNIEMAQRRSGSTAQRLSGSAAQQQKAIILGLVVVAY